MTIHNTAHPQAGQKVTLTEKTRDLPRGIVVAGAEFVVEDWWDRIGGTSWMAAEGNPPPQQYAIRAGFGGLPADDDVVYGHIGPYGHLVHASELPS